MSDEDHAAESTAEAATLVEVIKPLLAFREPEVVGAVLGQLLAILIAGHCPEMRAEAMKLVIDMANDLIPIEIDQMIDASQVGEDWRGTKQ
jgi:hypothetical protein